jgi:hypothetical protein
VTRHATCDTDGNFTFKGLPRAKWYIFTRVRWSAGDAGVQGAELIGEADTSAGAARVVLDDGNRV